MREPSAKIRGRVEKARVRQREQFGKAGADGESVIGTPGRPLSAGIRDASLQANADMGPAEVREYCKLDERGKQLIRTAMKQMSLGARAYHRILKLARTLASYGNNAADTRNG